MTKAPDFSLENMFSEEFVSLSSLKGKAVMITFWVSWCPDSKRDLINKEQLYRAMNTQDLEVLMIHVTGREPDRNAAYSYYEEQGFTFPVLSDRGTTVYDAYKCMSVPATFILDKEHNITASFNDKAPFQHIVASLGSVVSG